MDKRASNRRPGTNNDHGQSYERMLALCALKRCDAAYRDGQSQKIESYRIACNENGVDAFDDLVLRYDGNSASKTIFVQAKHKVSDFSVGVDDLLGAGTEEEPVKKKPKKEEPFLLTKYVKSFVKIVDEYLKKERGKVMAASKEDCHYVISTNCPMKADDVSYFDEMPVPKDELIDLITCKSCDEPNETCNHKYYTLKKSEKLEDWINNCDDKAVAEEFLSRLRLHLGQVGEKKLPDIIKHEMKKSKSLQSDALEVEFLYTYVSNRIERFWRYGDVADLTQATDLFERAKGLLELHKRSRQPQLESALQLYGFRSESLASLKDALDSPQGSKAINVLVRKEANDLVVMKLLQISKDKKTTCLLWDVGSVDITAAMLSDIGEMVKTLIVNFNGEARSHDKALDNLCAAKTKPETIVFIMDEGFTDLSNRLREKFGCKIVKEEVKFSDLDDESKSKIYDYNVLFQGELTNVGSILWDDSHITDLLVSVIEKREIKIGKPLTGTNGTHVKRLLEMVVLKEECLRDAKLTLAISGWENSKNSNIRDMCNSAKTFKFERNGFGNDEHFMDKRIFLLSDDGDFERVRCKRDKVHWLRIVNEKIHLVRSTGIVDELRKYIENEPERFEPEKNLQERDKVTLVYAEPGMGKTTLLDDMSSKVLRYREKVVWKIRIDLFKKIKKIKKFLKNEKVLEFLKHQSDLTPGIATKLFEHYFYKGNILIMLDGYDEVSAKWRHQIDRMIEIFAECNSLALIITSRTHEVVHLENKFGTLAYRLKPFSRDDAKRFLQSLCGTLLREEGIEKLCNNMVRALGPAFLKNPLYLKMVGKFVAEKKTPDFHLNILELFRHFSKKKIKIYCRGKGYIAGGSEQREFKSNFDEKHQIMALHTLFRKERLSLLYSRDQVWTWRIEKALSEVKKDRQRWQGMGLVSDFSDEGEAVFMHRTLAEYFAAMWLAEMCVDEHRIGRLGDFLKAIRFYDDRHESLRKFFDWAVVEKGDKEGPLRCHEAVLRGDWKAVKRHFADRNRLDKCGRTALHLAVVYDNDHIVELLLERGADPAVKDHILRWTPLCWAIYFERGKLVKTLAARESYDRVFEAAERVRQSVAIDSEKRLSIAREATTVDCTAVVDAMIDKGEPLVNDLIDGETLLHVAVSRHSARTAELLLKKGADLLAPDEYGETALEFARAFSEGNEIIKQWLQSYPLK